MAVAMYGADTEALRAMAGETDRLAAGVRASASTATLNVAGVGPDATQYRGDWAGTDTRTQMLAERIAAMSEALRRNAAEKDAASSAGPGSGGHGDRRTPGEDGSGGPRDRGPQPDGQPDRQPGDGDDRRWFERTTDDLLDDGRITWWQSGNGEWTLESGLRTVGGFSFGADGNLWGGQEGRWDVLGDQRGGRVGPKDNEAFLSAEGALGLGLDLLRIDYGDPVVDGSAAVTADAAAAASARIGTGGADARIGVSAFAGAKASLSAAEPIPIIGDYCRFNQALMGARGRGRGERAHWLQRRQPLRRLPRLRGVGTSRGARRPSSLPPCRRSRVPVTRRTARPARRTDESHKRAGCPDHVLS